MGAIGAGLIASRGGWQFAPIAVATVPPALPSAPPSSSPPATTPAAPAPEATFPSEPSPMAPPLGEDEDASGGPPASAAPPAVPGPWGTSPEPGPILGGHAPSQVPGDSTDAFLDPRTLEARPDASSRAAVPSVSDLDRLRDRRLLLPVEGYDVRRLHDNFAEKRGGRVHEAIDMLAPRGTPVRAVDDGVVKKLFTSAAGGLTVYEFDRDGAFSYYYAHLDRYAEGLREGQAVKKGDRLGYVGTTGNAPKNAPHLHFTIFKLAPTRRWWEGTPVDPYPLWALQH